MIGVLSEIESSPCDIVLGQKQQHLTNFVRRTCISNNPSGGRDVCSRGQPLMSLNVSSIFDGNAGAAQTGSVTTKAFFLNLATGAALFAFQLSGFFLLKSSNIGRRIYQPKTYLVQERLRVEAIPRNALKWITRIFKITDEELKLKCGLVCGVETPGARERLR